MPRPHDPKLFIARLHENINGVEPVEDEEVTWLSRHTPSNAFACCIGAGPWKIGRRTKVQQSFVDAIGDGDLADPAVLKRLSPHIQLDWQLKWFVSVHRALRKHKLKSFNEVFSDGGSLSDFSDIICKDDPPKVIALFLRDYMFIPCFPVDRHVRRWLEDCGLPQKAKHVEPVFFALNLNPSGYSRAIFNSKTSNPELRGTRHA